jgi:stage II sporulation protein D
MRSAAPPTPDIMKKPLLLFALCLVALSALHAGEPVIRVQIISTREEIVIEPAGNWKVLTSKSQQFPAGKQAIVDRRAQYVRLVYGDTKIEDTLLTLQAVVDSELFLVRDVPYGVGWWWAGREDRKYEGLIDIGPGTNGKLSVVVRLPLEKYLRGVVPYEIGSAPIEAMRAQAVAARSEAMAALRNRMYAGDGYDICGDVDCQVFGGLTRTTALIDRAIRTTKGIILQSKGHPINAYFASNCGGHSEGIENVWPLRSGPIRFWSAHPDADTLKVDSLQDEGNLRRWLADGPMAYCNPLTRPGLPDWGSRHWRWKTTTSAESLGITRQGPRAGRIVRIDSIRRGTSGRIISARFVGEAGNFRVGSELEFRQVWTPPLRSSCVVVDPQGPAEHPERFAVTGAGWGHGVGMCQAGAVGRALAGHTAERILRHYYPTAEIKPAY